MIYKSRFVHFSPILESTFYVCTLNRNASTFRYMFTCLQSTREKFFGEKICLVLEKFRLRGNLVFKRQYIVAIIVLEFIGWDFNLACNSTVLKNVLSLNVLE